MKINIIQKGSYYEFYFDENETPELTGRWKEPFFGKVYSEIFDSNGLKLVTIRLGETPWIWSKKKQTFLIEFHNDSKVITVTVVNKVRQHWSFIFDKENYDFYVQRGHKKSLFKSGEQIAKFDKRKVNLWQNDKGFIVANSDSNILLLLSLFLAKDMGEVNEADINVDLGNMLKGVKEYDESWSPKN